MNPVSHVKPFRIITDELTYSHIGTSLVHFKKSVKYVMEYKNPRAEEFYKKAQNTNDVFAKAELLEQMGDYELKSLNFKERLQDIFDRFLEKLLLK